MRECHIENFISTTLTRPELQWRCHVRQVSCGAAEARLLYCYCWTTKEEIRIVKGRQQTVITRAGRGTSIKMHAHRFFVFVLQISHACEDFCLKPTWLVVWLHHSPILFERVFSCEKKKFILEAFLKLITRVSRQRVKDSAAFLVLGSSFYERVCSLGIVTRLHRRPQDSWSEHWGDFLAAIYVSSFQFYLSYRFIAITTYIHIHCVALLKR